MGKNANVSPNFARLECFQQNKKKKRWKNLIDYEEMNERMEFQIFLFYAQIPCHIPISSECTCTARYNNLLFNNEREWNALWRKKNRNPFHPYRPTNLIALA